eukprot:TRINITY_DN1006_c0_g1_i2.p1 TRINITY_DN1006_c0_g1~~TRINITY_DN1006_c0_g1_i2.p1  ORF type:complete len:332 (+),score=48.31 TRINITY_DN1006_c0_g1_i2:50-997(+)
MSDDQLFSGFGRFLKDTGNSDVTIKLADSNKKYEGHRILLSYHSQEFMEALVGKSHPAVAEESDYVYKSSLPPLPHFAESTEISLFETQDSKSLLSPRSIQFAMMPTTTYLPMSPSQSVAEPVSDDDSVFLSNTGPISLPPPTFDDDLDPYESTDPGSEGICGFEFSVLECHGKERGKQREERVTQREECYREGKRRCNGAVEECNKEKRAHGIGEFDRQVLITTDLVNGGRIEERACYDDPSEGEEEERKSKQRRRRLHQSRSRSRSNSRGKSPTSCAKDIRATPLLNLGLQFPPRVGIQGSLQFRKFLCFRTR